MAARPKPKDISRLDAPFDFEACPPEEVGDPEPALEEPPVEVGAIVPESVGVAFAGGYAAPRALISKGSEVA